jgi:hypothetical protein
VKLRLDLLEHLTAEDILKEAVANQHRYKAEPSFSKTGVGSLSPASPADRAREIEHCTELTRKLKARAKRSRKA